MKIYREDITALSDSNVILDGGTSLRTDLLIYATAYEIAPTIFSQIRCSTPGSPRASLTPTTRRIDKWARLDGEAGAEI